MSGSWKFQNGDKVEVYDADPDFGNTEVTLVADDGDDTAIIEMLPDEARMLARELVAEADRIDGGPE